MNPENIWWLSMGVLFASCVYFVTTLVKFFSQKQTTKPQPTSELDELVKQERIDQAATLIPIIGEKLPIDVKAVTLILHYEDGRRLKLSADVQRIGVEL